MNDYQVPQANWTRYLNKLGANFRVDALISLDEELLLQTAMNHTGLSDFGDIGFRKPLAVLLRSLEDEAQLTLTGRVLAASDVLRILESRLRIVDTEKKYPEISREEIRSPIFVVGMGRTGTTILHELLAQDPNHRAPLLWEMVDPAPIASVDDGPGDKLVIADAFMNIFDEIDPSYVSKHEGGGELTNECSYMMLHEFYGTTFFGCHDVPSYMRWMARADPTPAFLMHKRILQMLQWGPDPKRRWVLKDPGHIGMLPALLETYPDALIVHTHRDPRKVVHSTTSLMASLRFMRSDQFSAETVTDMMNTGQAMSLEKLIDEREKGIVPESQIADVHFKEFLRDPISEVEKLYSKWDIEFSESARKAMQRYMDARPRTKHGKHEYACADAVDIEHESQKFERYVAHYGIERE